MATTSQAPSEQPLLSPSKAIPAGKHVPKPAHTPLWHKLRSYMDPTVYDVPDEHNTKLDVPKTVREYNRARQRARLLIGSSLQFFVTLLLCVLIAVVLYAYSRPVYLLKASVNGFSAIITILQIGVSINLASSLRSYAKILRWRILASSYRSLKEFDLILSCAEQSNVVKLLWHMRRRHRWYLPTRTQMVCLIWLLVNLASVIVVTLVSLTYSIDPSSTGVTARGGETSVLNLADPRKWIKYTNLLSTGAGISYQPTTPVTGAANGLPGHIYSCSPYTDCDSWAYGFQNTNAKFSSNTASSNSSRSQAATVWGPSGRSIFAAGFCEPLTISQQPSATNPILQFLFRGGNVTLDLQSQFVPGGWTYIWDSVSNCSLESIRQPRCAVIFAYHSSTLGPTESELYLCSSTIGGIEIAGDTGFAGAFENGELVTNLNDADARTLAGAIGFTSVRSSQGQYSFALYPQDNVWARPNETMGATDDTASNIASLVSMFPMAALATIDQLTDPDIRTTVSGQSLVVPQTLVVSWGSTLGLLAVIPFLQLLSLLAVVLWANNAIVKDDSNLSVAKFLAPTVSRLGDRGCLLTGDEMVEVLGKDDTRVAYNFDVRRREDRNDERDIMHVGLFEKKAGFTIEKTFPEGWYDGQKTNYE